MSDVWNPGRMRALAAVASAVLAAHALTGCSEDALQSNSLNPLIPLASFVVHDTTITATGSTTFKQTMPTNSLTNLVGKWGNYTAITTIAFLPSSFPARDTALVYGATMTLHFVTWFGDSTGVLAFNVYRITRIWTEGGLTWDTVQAGFYDQSVVRGSYSGSGGPDTQFVSIPLDTAMVRTWLATVTSVDTRYGVILVPAQSCSIIRGFDEFGGVDSLVPHLQIIAGSATGPERDTTTYTSGGDSWGGNIDNLNTNPQLIYVQAGVDWQANLSFNVSFIPRGAIINSAVLLLQNDPATSHLSRFANDTSITAQAALSPSDRTLLDAASYATTGTIRTGTSHTFSTDVRRPVQLWLQTANYGITIRPNLMAEITSFNLLTFFNERASRADFRPRVKITYSVAR